MATWSPPGVPRDKTVPRAEERVRHEAVLHFSLSESLRQRARPLTHRAWTAGLTCNSRSATYVLRLEVTARSP